MRQEAVRAAVSRFVELPIAPRSVVAIFNDQRIVVRSWPLRENRVVFAEFHD